MNTDMLFSLSGTVALAGWAALCLSLTSVRLRFLRSVLARRIIPLVLAALYTALIAGFFATAKGGYGSLDDVSALFQTRELLLAGWIHYLAFDLFVGTHLAEQAQLDGVPRLAVLPVLALTFLFGPAGFLAYPVVKVLLTPARIIASSPVFNKEIHRG